MALVFLTNIVLDCNVLPGTNAIAYFSLESMKKKKKNVLTMATMEDLGLRHCWNKSFYNVCLLDHNKGRYLTNIHFASKKQSILLSPTSMNESRDCLNNCSCYQCYEVLFFVNDGLVKA